MSVKAVCIKGHWSIRVNWRTRRRTRQVTPNTEARALEVAEKLRIALDLYGADALRMLDERRCQEPKAVPTVAEYAARWISELDKTDLKRTTRESYRYLIEKHAVPAFGSRGLDEITYSGLKEWIISRAGRYSARTIRLMAGAMRALMAEAVRDGHIARNPVQDLGRFYRLGRKRRAQIDPFTRDELYALEDKSAERFPEHYGFLLVLSRTGMRIGEATGLQWHDLDERRAQVLVRRNVPRHRQVETTKTPGSERRVDLSPDLLGELVRLKRERKAECLKAGREFRADEWIFRTRAGTAVEYGNFRSRVWHRVQDLAHVRRRTIHELRHTWASQMLAAGADPAYVAAQLGHASVLTTLLIYAHWIRDGRKVTAAVLDRKNANGMQTDLETERRKRLRRV